MRQRNIPQPFTAGQANQAIARQAARVAPALGRAAGLFGRVARIAAAPEASVAVAAGGLAYGIGEDLLSNYGYANSTKSIPQRTKPPLTDPISRGSRKVPHRHIRDIQKKSEVIYDPEAPRQPEVQHVTLPPPVPTVQHVTQQPEVQAAPQQPEVQHVPPQQPEVQHVPLPPVPTVQAVPLVADPAPQQPEVQAIATPVSPLPGRFQQSLVDLRGQSQPVHGFKISRTRPYNLTAWERAARAKAQTARGYRVLGHY